MSVFRRWLHLAMVYHDFLSCARFGYNNDYARRFILGAVVTQVVIVSYGFVGRVAIWMATLISHLLGPLFLGAVEGIEIGGVKPYKLWLEVGVEPPRPPAYQRLLDGVCEWLLGHQQEASIMLGVFACLVMLRLLFRLPVRRMSYRLRGIRFEAVKAGSELLAGVKEPAFQPRIMQPGLFVNSFQGYGIRLGKFLVLPRHVYDACEGQVMMRGPKASYIIANAPIQSRVVRDLVYIPLAEKVFSDCGIPSANMARRLAKGALVTCIGEQGASSGIIRPLSIMGMLSYTGTTVPGMSGAAYIVNSTSRKVHGIHHGVVGENNVGTSCLIVAKELRALEGRLFGESPLGNEVDEQLAHKRGGYKAWAEDDLDEVVLDAWEVDDDDWAYDDDAMDYEEDVIWDQESDDDFWDSGPTRDYGESYRRKKKKRAVRRVKGLGHAADKPEIDISQRATVREVITEMGNTIKGLQHEVAQLKKKVSTLEAKVPDRQKLAQQVDKATSMVKVQPKVDKAVPATRTPVRNSPPVSRGVLCTECKKRFPDARSLVAHNASKHMKPESAIKEDAKKVVKTRKGRFLGNSPKNPGDERRDSSRLSPRSSQFRSILESQSKMSDCLSKLEKSFALLAQAMAGQSSGQRRN
uniref:C2H2-type domain-containing protein n=1 Tax=Reticulitermes chinensis sobeli-like virus 1 TaxID=3133519 RepID=A0AAT9JFA2_9VIRU